MGLFKRKSNNEKEIQIQKYNIRPEKNVPQKLYGVPDYRVYPDTDEQRITVEIKNNSAHYGLVLSKDDKRATLAFGNINKMEKGKYLIDMAIDIPTSAFDEFCTKITNVTDRWGEDYYGQSQNHWEVQINTIKTNRIIIGKGGFPGNWNQFIDLLIEYEMLFKKGCKSIRQ